MKIKTVALCRDAEGAPTFVTHIFDLTSAAVEEGRHLELMAELAEDEGYEFKFAFDERDPAATAIGELVEFLA